MRSALLGTEAMQSSLAAWLVVAGGSTLEGVMPGGIMPGGVSPEGVMPGESMPGGVMPGGVVPGGVCQQYGKLV